MSDEELNRLIGRLLAQIENMQKRVARMENAILAVLCSAAALWAKSQGLW